MNAEKKFVGISSVGTDYLNKAAQGSLGTTFPGGHGMAVERTADDEINEMADAVDAALSQPLPAPTGTDKDRLIFEKSIAARRAEKAKQQQIAADAIARSRALTVSIRAMEDALDGMLVA